MPQLMWLSGLSATLQTKGSPVRFPVRAHAWVAGQVPSRGGVGGNYTLIFLSLSPSLPLSPKISKYIKSLKRNYFYFKSMKFIALQKLSCMFIKQPSMPCKFFIIKPQFKTFSIGCPAVPQPGLKHALVTMCDMVIQGSELSLSSLCTLCSGHCTQSQGFGSYLYADEFQIYFSIPV